MQYVILAAIAIAGADRRVDATASARRRRLVQVPALVASALGGRRTGPRSGIAVRRPGVRGCRRPSTCGTTLADRVDPETFAPTLAAGTEIKMFRLRWGNDYAIVARPDHRSTSTSSRGRRS